MKTIESCTNITSTFCDLTEAWEDFYENYFILVEGFQGAASLVNCSAVFTSVDCEWTSVCQLPHHPEHHLYSAMRWGGLEKCFRLLA